MTLTEKLMQQDRRLTPVLQRALRTSLLQRKRVLCEMSISKNSMSIRANLSVMIQALNERINNLNCSLIVDRQPTI